MALIDLRRLRAFVALAEEGHVTRAAERLGMQQPPLTRLLQSLEADLGVLLMHRMPRGVRPTEAGKVLLDEARIILARADGVAAMVHRAARGEQGHLAIGFTSSAALHPIVPKMLRAFRENLPQVSVSLEEAGTAELVDALLHERLDAAFIRSPVGRTPGLRIDSVLEEPMLVALPVGHRLATDSASRLLLTELASEPFILYRRSAGPGLYDTILTACREAGFSPVVAQEAPRLTATLSLVAAGFGISLVPASMQRLGGEGIVYKAVAGSSRLIAPLLLAMRQAHPVPALAQFRSLVQRIVAAQEREN
ncbi:LysR family transcriptional regulator [Phyllobacterium sp. P30BS-XVII]|uniref:LysR family transcriptional regulator n=1 Tax=Phyllobacterium sp. P30BS-XVII TaxID=2587046 RepID=UPI0015FC69CD|nr:LysR family transcriptional regulator [Phyllobacterium sp. P30BS-XVII]MBA8899840.1 DNA-binding transcriptional LysR family regulator [Phyllobacterium sp. P30BS-XVII]